MSYKPKFRITNVLTSQLTKIERARGFLEGALLTEEWISHMQKKALVLEAHYTTHIEGTELTLKQSEDAWEGKHVENANPDDVQELLNFREAFELVASYLQNGDPITESLIREIHKQLVKDVRGNSAMPGEYRTVQNYVVNSQTGATIYTPPEAFLVPTMMRELIDWLNHDHDIHPVLISGIAQFHLVHIHPFLDGNGRTARLLSTLMLYANGYDFKKLFTISEYYDKDRPAYYTAIQSVRESGMDMTHWLEYFVEGLASQLTFVESHAKSLMNLDTLAQKHSLNLRQKRALELALTEGTFTIAHLKNEFPDLSKRTLQRDIKQLVSSGLLAEEGATSTLRYTLP